MKLLQVAAEILGGEEALAERLGITYARMLALLQDRVALSDRLLLKAVDIIIEDRHARGALPSPKIYERPGHI